MKFAVLSDTHYISEEMLYGEQPKAVLRKAVNLTVLRQLKERDDIDTVLITGDLTDAGDEASHREFSALLADLKASGKKVYVLTATHDFHFSRAWVMKYGWPVKYKAAPWNRPWFDPDECDYTALVKEESLGLFEAGQRPPLMRVCNADELWEIYRDFGRDQAFSVCESAWSYAVKLDEKTWCLMLNNNFRDVDANFDFSPTYSPACFAWIEEIVKKAKAEGVFVFACTHHPLVPPVPAYKLGGTTRNMRNSTVAHTLADLGIPLVFSGHTHFANIVFGSSDAGKLICNVTTPAISFLPPVYRIAELDGPAGTLKLTNAEITAADGCPVAEKTLKEHYINEFIAEQRASMERLPAGLGKVVLGMKVKHFYPLVAAAGRLTRAEYESIKEKKIFDIIMDCAINMQCGDGQYTPDTPVYKFMMGLCAVADSVIAAQPFFGLEKRLQGYTTAQIVEPMLFKNGVPDNNACFRFDRVPSPTAVTPVFTSRAGDVLMALLSVFALLISPASPALTALAIPALTLLKKNKLKKQPPRPERY